jgi:hypothetical protein
MAAPDAASEHSGVQVLALLFQYSPEEELNIV